MTVDITITDGQAHRVALYLLDWDNEDQRTETIDVLDAASQTVLDEQHAATFSVGRYLIWDLCGHVQLRFTWTGGYNSVLSGVLFSPAELDTPPDATPGATRMVAYTYDELQRLTTAAESPGIAYAYAYDDAGNRSGVWLGGTRTQTFNAANQLDGLTYDAAGNLVNDGSAASAYDALNRMTLRSTTPYTYNGDGALVDDGATQYTQDLASPLTQVLQTTQGSTTTKYLYGLDRLAAVAGSARTWYGYDALGSVRMTLDDTGAPLGVVNYDPWGSVESGSVPTFGFTGEVQSGGLVNLRARWYATGQGRFVERDPFADNSVTPQTLH